MTKITQEIKDTAFDYFRKEFKTPIEISELTGISLRSLSRIGITGKSYKELVATGATKDIREGKTESYVREKYGITLPKAKEAVKVTFSVLENEIQQHINLPFYRTVPAKTTSDGKRNPRLSIEDTKHGKDLWNFPNDARKIGKVWYKETEKGGLKCPSTENIPFMEYNPAKRISLASHTIFGIKTVKNERILYVNWLYLINPDTPLIKAKRHDVRTANVKVGFPAAYTLKLSDTSEEERRKEAVREVRGKDILAKDEQLTELDSCIISEDLAKRMRFRELVNQTFYCHKDEDVERTFPVTEGESFTKTGIESYDEQNVVKATGTFYRKSQRKLGDVDFKAIRGFILLERNLQLGDKLVGLSGLKVVIGEIRPNEQMPNGVEIIISKKQLWGSKPSSQRGAMVKELTESGGYLMVGLRRDELPEVSTNLSKGASISNTLYPVLKIYAPQTLKRMVNDSSEFLQLLKTFHLQLNVEGRAVLLPENKIDLSDEHWLKCEHVLYEGIAKRQQPGNKFAITQVTYPEEHTIRTFARKTGEPKELPGEERLEESWITEQTEETEQAKYQKRTKIMLLWKHVYLPSFLTEGYLTAAGNVSRYQIQHMKDKTLNENRAQGYTGLPYSFETPHRGKEGFQKAMSRFMIENQLFTPLRNGVYLRVIPKIKGDVSTIEVNNKRLEGKGLIHREPVTGKNNVFSVTVIHNPNLPPRVLRIAPSLIQAATGDFDGDCIALNPYSNDNLVPQIKDGEPDKEQIKKGEIFNTVPVWKASWKDVKDIKPRERTREELIFEAVEYENDKITNGAHIEEVGGVRKTASFSTSNVETQLKILIIAAEIENIMKEEREEDYMRAIKDMKKLIVPVCKPGEDREYNPETHEYNCIYQNSNVNVLLDPAKGGFGKPVKEAGLYAPPHYERMLWFKALPFWKDLFTEGVK